jgi:hypothetical protein
MDEIPLIVVDVSRKGRRKVEVRSKKMPETSRSVWASGFYGPIECVCGEPLCSNDEG